MNAVLPERDAWRQLRLTPSDAGAKAVACSFCQTPSLVSLLGVRGQDGRVVIDCACENGVHPHGLQIVIGAVNGRLCAWQENGDRMGEIRALAQARNEYAEAAADLRALCDVRSVRAEIANGRYQTPTAKRVQKRRAAPARAREHE